MQATMEDRPCGKPEWRKPQRGDDDRYLSSRVCVVGSAQWDDDSTDNTRWSLGNVFVSHAQAEPAQHQMQELLTQFHAINREEKRRLDRH
jgi:hypothetical protein